MFKNRIAPAHGANRTDSGTNNTVGARDHRADGANLVMNPMEHAHFERHTREQTPEATVLDLSQVGHTNSHTNTVADSNNTADSKLAPGVRLPTLRGHAGRVDVPGSDSGGGSSDVEGHGDGSHERAAAPPSDSDASTARENYVTQGSRDSYGGSFGESVPRRVTTLWYKKGSRTDAHLASAIEHVARVNQSHQPHQPGTGKMQCKCAHQEDAVASWNSWEPHTRKCLSKTAFVLETALETRQNTAFLQFQRYLQSIRDYMATQNLYPKPPYPRKPSQSSTAGMANIADLLSLSFR